MNNQKKDFRGMDLRADNFKNQLLMLVNNCNLDISTAYFIVKDMCNTLEKGFDKAAAEQYQEFCEISRKEAEAAAKESKAAPANQEEKDKAE